MKNTELFFEQFKYTTTMSTIEQFKQYNHTKNLIIYALNRRDKYLQYQYHTIHRYDDDETDLTMPTIPQGRELYALSILEINNLMDRINYDIAQLNAIKPVEIDDSKFMKLLDKQLIEFKEALDVFERLNNVSPLSGHKRKREE